MLPFRWRTAFTTAAAMLLAITAVLGGLPLDGTPTAAAAPVSGATRWAVLLCKFSDHPEEPRTAQFFRDFFTETGANTGGMFDYWRDVSYGRIDLTGSKVFGWYTMNLKVGEQKNTQISLRQERIDTCIGAAQSGGANLAGFYRTAVILNTTSELGSQAGRVVLDPGGWNATVVAHEMGHAYGLDHSFDRYPVSWDPGNDSRPGAYGDVWDIMSAMHVNSYQGSFGRSGPGMNAPNLDTLGWLPSDRVFSTRVGVGSVELAALNVPNARGYLAAKLTDPANPSHYYTVELRHATGWDQQLAKLGGDAVLIHEVASDGLSYLIDLGNPQTWGGAPADGAWRAGQEFDNFRGSVQVRIVCINEALGTATVTVLPAAYGVCGNGETPGAPGSSPSGGGGAPSIGPAPHPRVGPLPR